MIITYSRPETIGHQVDPAAPAANLDPAGATCDATTYDIDGTPWRCTRRPGHVDDEHRAAYERGGDGPEGAVAFAWQYEWGGAGYGPSSSEALHSVTVTVTFPQSAATGVDASRIAEDVLSNFWECDHDHVHTTVSTAEGQPAAVAALRELIDLAERGRADFLHQAEYGNYTAADIAAAEHRWQAMQRFAAEAVRHTAPAT